MRKRESGFTLIELLVVVVIIGILAAVALPKLFSAICTSNQGAADGVISGINSGMTLYFGENRGRMPSVGSTALTATTPAWFTKYYEVPTDPWGNTNISPYIISNGQNYTVCFAYNNGLGCDGVVDQGDDGVYFNSQRGSMVTGNISNNACL